MTVNFRRFLAAVYTVPPLASASPAPADARRGLVGLLRSADAWHSRGGAGRTARARDRRPCSSFGLGSQGDRRRTPSRSSCRSTRRQRARPSIADGQELDNCFMDCDSTRVLARSIHRLYIEGSGGNLSPHSFHPTVRIIGADPTALPLPELRRGPRFPLVPWPDPLAPIPSCARYRSRRNALKPNFLKRADRMAAWRVRSESMALVARILAPGGESPIVLPRSSATCTIIAYALVYAAGR
jgi:hypothetical protein